MARLIGIRSAQESLLHPPGYFSSLIPSLKQQYLLFDSLGFIGLNESTDDTVYGINKNEKSEIDWLKEHNIIYNIDYPKRPRDEEGGLEFLQYMSDIGMGDDYWEFFLPIVEQSYKNLKTFTRRSKKHRRDWNKKLIPLLQNLSMGEHELPISLKEELDKLILDSQELI
jgi:hypothetical protein